MTALDTPPLGLAIPDEAPAKSYLPSLFASPCLIAREPVEYSDAALHVAPRAFRHVIITHHGAPCPQASLAFPK